MTSNFAEHQSTQLLITHGGQTTVKEALYRAVPILGMPMQADQASNIRRLQELGATDMLVCSDLSTDLLHSMVESMMANIDGYNNE